MTIRLCGEVAVGVLCCIAFAQFRTLNPKLAITVVEFEAENKVCIEGRHFTLNTDYDICVARAAFVRSYNFYFKNIFRTNFRMLWRFAYCQIPDGGVPWPLGSSLEVYSMFGVISTNTGRALPIRFGRRQGDRFRNIVGTGELCSNQRVFTVDPGGRRSDRRQISDMNKESLKNTYLEFWCDRHLLGGEPVSGMEIEEVLDRFYKFAPIDADAYLVPYEGCSGI